MKKLNVLMTCLVVASCVVALEAVAQEITYTGPPITIRYSHFAPDTHKWVKGAVDPWVELVAKESKGKLLIKKYFSATLHGPRDGFKACVNDITDMSVSHVSQQASSFNLLPVLTLPFAFERAAVGAKVAEELSPKYFKKEIEKMGVYFAGAHPTSTYHFLTKKPIRKLEDMKGMKIRSTGGPNAEMLKLMGAVPITLTPGEQYSAFQRGMVDGICMYHGGFVSYRLHEIGKYVTELSFVAGFNEHSLNRKTFDNLPNDLKKYFYNMLRRFHQMSGIAYDKIESDARREVIAKGIEIITPTPSEKAKFVKAVMPIWEIFIRNNEKLGLPARELVDEYGRLAKKYSSWTDEQLLKDATENPVHGIIDGM